MKQDIKLATKPDDVPNGKHYAVVVFKTIDHEDGWGCQTTSNAPEYYVTPDKSVWELFVKDLEGKIFNRNHYVAFVVEAKAKTKTTITIDVEIE